jgi:hypothetical protein
MVTLESPQNFHACKSTWEQVQPGLPNGLYSFQISKFWHNLQGLGVDNFGIDTYFMVIWDILWSLGIFPPPFWYAVPKQILQNWQPLMQLCKICTCNVLATVQCHFKDRLTLMFCDKICGKIWTFRFVVF